MNISFINEEKQYRKLFLAGIVNGIGDRFSSVAVLAMLLHLTDSGLAVGMTLAIRLIPSLFFGPIGGILADRFSRKTILVGTDLIRMLFALSFIFVQSKEDIWIVYVSSFILAAGEAIYGPARKSAIPYSTFLRFDWRYRLYSYFHFLNCNHFNESISEKRYHLRGTFSYRDLPLFL